MQITHGGCDRELEPKQTSFEHVNGARDYFNNEQLKNMKYDPVLTSEDQPAIHLNKELMEQMRPRMTSYYYNPKKYRMYLEQLGIAYPGVPAAISAPAAAP